MNLISIPSGKISVKLNQAVTINDVRYNELIAICRLLTLDEINRIDNLAINNLESQILVEEDIFNIAFECFVGIEEAFDLDGLEAGVISTISKAILDSSYSYIINIESQLQQIRGGIMLIDNMQAIIARYLNINFLEVIKLPINEVYRLFAICEATFPEEVKIEKQNA